MTAKLPSVLPLAVLLLALASGPAYGQHNDEKKSDSTLLIDLPAPEGEVLQAVESVSGDGVIHGSQVYAKEPILDGAYTAETSAYYGKWQGGGHVYYKIKDDAISPRHFKNSADLGKITIRYVVEGLSAVNTKLQIDAVFINGGGRIYPSDGTVETAEFSEIQDRIRAIEYQKKKDAEAMLARQEYDLTKADPDRLHAAEVAKLNASEAALHNTLQRLHELQHQLEVRVKPPGAKLKSAPFHSATDMRTLSADDQLLILIITPYWYGIETTDGQHGWIARNAVEPVP